MDQNLEKRSEIALTKSKIAEFVHDMKELEIKLFTLKKLHEECTMERNAIEYNGSPKIIEAETKLKQIGSSLSIAQSKARGVLFELNQALQTRKTEPQKIIGERPKRVREPTPILSVLIGIVIIAVIIALTARIGTESSAIIAAIMVLVVVVFLFIINVKAENRYYDYLCKIQNYNREYSRYTQELDEYREHEQRVHKHRKQYEIEQKNYEDIQKKHELAQKNLEEAKKQYQKEISPQIKKLDDFSQFLIQHISVITERKNQLYSLNIVPPDYRTLDSMIEIDQMYRNNLVDTMREAIMIYEERVRHGELIKGIDKIYTMLGRMNSTMHNIESTLYNIRNDVHILSDDICMIASSTEKFQENILFESRATRYATEALQESVDCCEKYIDQYMTHQYINRKY